MPEIQIKVDHVKKIFRVGTQEIEILKDISFEIEKGDFAVLSGPSGCGKSTTLHTILGLEPPTSGKVTFFDQDLYSNTTEDDRSIFRKRNVGMVYQQANWIKALNVRENVSFPLTLLGISKHEAFTKSIKVLNDLGMGNWAEYVPLELSSGQQQRVALARALVNDPKIIVADEPTGNLDYKSGVEIMELLSKLNKEMQKTIIMVTHDLEYLKFSNKVVRIFDGSLEGVYTGEALQKLIGSVSFKRGSMDGEESATKSEKTGKANKSDDASVVAVPGTNTKEAVK
ncbi:ABC transporter ATP-binding protein [candidate division WWE3 bacterium]|uniref:ABC transporter ATP-binding protein n=1 Tax=candidate division WWE3 bacterium TaxID=2053526 RepID=A0A7X9DJJ2_UNCKA|nr:ABC transporter ATP-binding protein [candidate division WWE3 bacterium]